MGCRCWEVAQPCALRGIVSGGNSRRPGKAVVGFILRAALLAIVMLGVGIDATSGEIAKRRKSIDPQRFNAAAGYPGANVDPVPLPGPRPYWGQALGGTYYNWGFFGARHDRAQFVGHAGYYGEHFQFGYTRGY